MSASWKVERDDVLDAAAYDAVREETIRRVLALKQLRRVPLGDRVSLAFECKATVLFQLHEMLRAAGARDEARIREELSAHEELLPRRGELAAMVFVESGAAPLFGVEECLWMEIGAAHRLAAWFEPGQSREGSQGAVFGARFRLSPPMREAFQAGATVALAIEHPHYRARTELPPAQAAELAGDLA